MKELILNLKTVSIDVENHMAGFDKISLEHGSLDQARAMMIESIFQMAINNINGAIKQLEIIQRE